MASSPDRPGEQPGGPDDEVAQRGPEPGVPAPRPERDELAKYLWWARFGGGLGLLVSVLAWVATGDDSRDRDNSRQSRACGFMATIIPCR